MSTDKYVTDMEAPPAPRLAIAVMGLLLAGVIILVLIQRLRQPEGIIRSTQILQATRPVSPNELTVISRDDVTVYVPPNSIDLDGTISIAPAEPNLFQAAFDKWTRTRVVIIEFLSFGDGPVPNISFFQPIEICFSLTEEQWQNLMLDPNLYQVHYYADQENPPRWEMLPKTTYPDRFQLCGQTSHLSVFGLATKLETGIPVTGATATATMTATVISPNQTPERRNRDRDEPGPAPVPTNPPPTDPPPTQPPTEPPPTDPPTEPPPTEPPSEPPPPTEPPSEPPPTEPPIISLPPLPIPILP